MRRLMNSIPALATIGTIAFVIALVMSFTI